MTDRRVPEPTHDPAADAEAAALVVKALGLRADIERTEAQIEALRKILARRTPPTPEP